MEQISFSVHRSIICDNEADSFQNQSKSNLSDPCPEYQLSRTQNGLRFWAVLLTPIKVFNGDPNYFSCIPDFIQAHKLVKNWYFRFSRFKNSCYYQIE